MLYDSNEAGSVGYACGHTYLTGGRPPLNLEQQIKVAASLAGDCCKNLLAQETFINQFKSGYADRVNTPQHSIS